MKKIKIGDHVKCIHSVKSNYGNKFFFQPDMVGVVVDIMPKVYIQKNYEKDPRYDAAKDFLVVDCIDGNEQKQRVALNFCNAEIA